MGATSTDNFCLRWNDFAENVSGAFKELRAENDFFDVTLACSDSGARTLQAHKVILSACSNFFKTTFRQQMNAHKHPNPYIYLRGVSYSDLVSILDFIYNGEVNVAQEDLNSFLAVAEELQIKGLTNREGNNSSNNDTPGSGGNTTNSTSSASKKHKRPAMDSQTPVKKVRRSSPAPIASAAPTSELKEDKDMVNIKDDPEVIHGMASTSAVNPDEAAEYAGEDFDESYDGYYEDEGTELGESGEATDGTKGLWTLVPENTKFAKCMVCNVETTRNKMQRHLKEVHSVGLLIYKCPACDKSFKRKYKYEKHTQLCSGSSSSSAGGLLPLPITMTATSAAQLTQPPTTTPPRS